MAADRPGRGRGRQAHHAGQGPGGIVVTILIGIAGALLAYYITPLLGITIEPGWQSYAAAIVGSVVLLALYRVVMAKRS
ncbi:MAG: GlsB/YeaQ/YmgE family stress response membrane protein [Sphingomonas sp.]